MTVELPPRPCDSSDVWYAHAPLVIGPTTIEPKEGPGGEIRITPTTRPGSTDWVSAYLLPNKQRPEGPPPRPPEEGGPTQDFGGKSED
jgi:hypothetical protein